MACKPPFLPFLLLWALVSIATASPLGLGADISALIPACAQPCLLNFINSNFPNVNCGTAFSRPCLCSIQSSSGFTLGEGALQCLLGDFEVGQCSQSDLSDNSSVTALRMCSGLASALPITHSVLTATIVLNPSGSASLIQSSPSEMTITSLTQTRTRTASTTRSTASSLVSSLSPSLPLTTSSTVSLLPTATPTATTKPSSSKALQTGQIVGVAVGVAGAIGIAAAAILFARCLRHRRYGSDLESEKGFYQNSVGGASTDLLGSRASRIFHISPPILRTSRYRPNFPPRPAPPILSAYQPNPPTPATSVNRGSTIGLAISRPRSLLPTSKSWRPQSPALSPRPTGPLVERRSSRLLPPRPALTLNIPSSRPPAISTASSQAPPRTTTTDRTSTLTNMTGFADLDTEAPEGAQIWRPPLSDPQSATALYVADKYGNWVLSSPNRLSQLQSAQITEAAELDTYTPLTKSPIEKQEEAAAARMAAAISAASMPVVPQPAFLNQDPATWTNSRGSSLHSQPSLASVPRQPGRRNSAGRSSSSRPRKGSGVGGGPAVNRSDSQASATTIQTSTSGGDDISYPDIARLSQLSPVEESPDSGLGRSRVTYPRIPGRLGGATIRHVQPPKRPDFTGSPPGQPSPTLGVVLVRDSPSAYPSPLKPQRTTDMPFTPTQRTGSGFTPESVNIEVFAPNSSPHRSTPSPPGHYSRARGLPIPASGSSPPPAPRQQQRQAALQTPTRQPVATFTPSPPSMGPKKRPTTPSRQGTPDRGTGRRSPRIITQQHAVSPISIRTVSSTTSSLLAKRLGSDKAAAFTTLEAGRKAQQQWRRNGDAGGLLSPDAAAGLISPVGTGTLPMTPTWQPRLTPTRRGDDLYLNVQ